MPNCKKCKNSFPNRIKIDDKFRILNKRKYCLACSPFGKNNRKQLEKKYENCKICGKKLKSLRRSACTSCSVNKSRLKIRNKVHELVGEFCWICGYGGKEKRNMLDFHHVIKKKFGINMSEINKRWTTVLKELKKCILVDCRCHREIECGLIHKKKVLKLHREFWSRFKEG